MRQFLIYLVLNSIFINFGMFPVLAVIFGFPLIVAETILQLNFVDQGLNKQAIITSISVAGVCILAYFTFPMLLLGIIGQFPGILLCIFLTPRIEKRLV